MSGLLAKELPAPTRSGAAASAELAGEQLLYLVEWQAHTSNCGGDSSAGRLLAGGSGAVAAAAAWSFGARTVAVRHAPWHSDAGWAAANLEAVQKVGDATGHSLP